jgi:hypothetical protein
MSWETWLWRVVFVKIGSFYVLTGDSTNIRTNIEFPC